MLQHFQAFTRIFKTVRHSYGTVFIQPLTEQSMLIFLLTPATAAEVRDLVNTLERPKSEPQRPKSVVTRPLLVLASRLLFFILPESLSSAHQRAANDAAGHHLG